MMREKIPFYSNTSDNTHCFQASLKMLLKYYFPNENYTWSRLDQITHKPKDKWTWPMAGMTYMKKKGLDTIQIVRLDYGKIAVGGHEYLKGMWDEDYYKVQTENSDIDLAIKDAKVYAKQKIQQVRSPTLKDVRKLLKDGYLLICNVNGMRLSGMPGYTGHFVVLFGLSKKYVTLHNPGLPAISNLKVLIPDFLAAWNDGLDLMAFKLKTQ